MNAIDPHLSALASPALLLCMALICGATWTHYRRHVYLLWLAASQMLLALGLSIQTLQNQSLLHHTALATTLLYVLGEVALAQAMAQRMGQRIQPVTATLLGALTMAGMWYFSHISPSIPGRLTVLSLGLGAILCHTLPTLGKVPARHRLDHVSRGIYVTAALLTIARPLLLVAEPSTHLHTWMNHSLIWWLTLTGVMILNLPYTLSMAGSALMDTMHTLRRERDNDSLTGLLNRRALQETCSPKPYQRGMRVLVLCDIDHFKRINDRYGHSVGDDVLRTFGQVLHTHLREGDVVARIGGEEFAIALWQQDLAKAHCLIERLQQQFTLTQWSERAQEPLLVTASFGMVQVQPQESLLESMERADALLYAAKHAGRNRIFSEGDTAPLA